MSRNNEKNWGHDYMAVYQDTKNIFSYDMSQYEKNSAYTMSFNVFEVPEWVLQYRNIWNEVELQLLEKPPTDITKGEGKQKLKTEIRQIFMVKMFHFAMQQQC